MEKGNNRMKFVLAYAFPIVLLVIFMLIMTIGPEMKKYLDGKDEYYLSLQQIEAAVEREQWQTAWNEVQNLDQKFTDMVPWIQFSVERNEMDEFQLSLAKIRGYIKAHDTGGALASIYAARDQWESLKH